MFAYTNKKEYLYIELFCVVRFPWNMLESLVRPMPLQELNNCGRVEVAHMHAVTKLITSLFLFNISFPHDKVRSNNVSSECSDGKY